MKNFVLNILIVGILFTGCSTVEESTQEVLEQQVQETQGTSRMGEQRATSSMRLSELDPNNEYESVRFSQYVVPNSLIRSQKYNHFFFFHKVTKARYVVSLLGYGGGYQNNATVVITDGVSNVIFQGKLKITAMRSKKTGEFALVLLDGNNVLEFPGGIGFAIIMNKQSRVGISDRLNSSRIYNSGIGAGVYRHTKVEPRNFFKLIDLVPISTNDTGLFEILLTPNFNHFVEFRYFGDQDRKYYWMRILPLSMGFGGMGDGTEFTFEYAIMNDERTYYVYDGVGEAKITATLDRLDTEGTIEMIDSRNGRNIFKGTYPEQKYLNIFRKKGNGTRGNINSVPHFWKSHFILLQRPKSQFDD